jgi:hypothetical protein
MEKKRWKGGAIYLRENGTIEKVVGRDGKEIKPEKEKRPAHSVTRGTPTPVIIMGSDDDPEQRCIYTASGDCYCT